MYLILSIYMGYVFSSIPLPYVFWLENLIHLHVRLLLIGTYLLPFYSYIKYIFIHFILWTPANLRVSTSFINYLKIFYLIYFSLIIFNNTKNRRPNYKHPFIVHNNNFISLRLIDGVFSDASAPTLMVQSWFSYHKNCGSVNW